MLCKFVVNKLKTKLLLEFIFYNWGGRIRTYEWRSQSPQPYRLATPQTFNLIG